MPVQQKILTDSLPLGFVGTRLALAAGLAVPLLVGIGASIRFLDGSYAFLPTLWLAALLVSAFEFLVPAAECRRPHFWFVVATVGTITASWLLGPVLHRGTGLLFFGSLAGAGLFYGLPLIVDTFAGYLVSDPIMPNSKPPAFDYTPCLCIAAAYLLIILAAPPVLGTVLILGLSACVAVYHDDLKALALIARNAVHVFADAKDDLRQGTWKPDHPRWQRIALLTFILSSTTLALAVWIVHGVGIDSWSIIHGLVMVVVTPFLILFAIALPACAQLHAWTQELKRVAAADTRSDLEKLIDKDAAQ